MSGNLQRSDQNHCDLELVDSVTGSGTACANISRKLLNIQGTSAGCLSRPLSLLSSGFSSISQSYTTAGYYLEHREPIWGKNVSLSVKNAQERCQQISIDLSTILDRHGEWDVLAAGGCCRRLNMMSKSLQVLTAYQDLLFGILDLIPVLLRKPAEHESSSDKWSGDDTRPLRLVRKILRLVNKRSKELLVLQVVETPPQTTEPEDLQMMDDWSTTQSTMGITTPTEDWSDMGSDITERGHTPAITRHSLQLCGYAAANFLRLVKELRDTVCRAGQLTDTEGIQRLREEYGELLTKLLHSLDAPVPHLDHCSIPGSMQRVVTDVNMSSAIQGTMNFLDRNNDIEESFGHLPGSTPLGTADVQIMHKAYGDLVLELHYHLAALLPFQNDPFASALVPPSVPAPVPVPAPEISRPVVPDFQSEACIDKTLEIIIASMESEPTDKDIMKLVFHWTTLEECNGFKRAEVMKFD